ncbi:hypothetical protein PoB_002745800 [Plakobranchus ocellatus]|uniref:Uncharacterized protein n=1 Tax=Plakobranchus ocellatus TaxID=259542 RepID=A0AAV4A1D0_9GAST|nr:hypothetical protein PoB_002745800 [Plakobranchus ocellatus]
MSVPDKVPDDDDDDDEGFYVSNYNATSESALTPVVISSSNHRDSGNVITASSNRTDPGIITKLEANISSGSNKEEPEMSSHQWFQAPPVALTSEPEEKSLISTGRKKRGSDCWKQNSMKHRHEL